MGKTIFVRKKHEVAPIFKKREAPPHWWVRWVPAVALGIGVAYLAYVVGRIAVIPVLASFALAYILNPIALRYQKFGLSRSVAALCALISVFGGAGLLLWLVVPDLWARGVAASDMVLRQFSPANAEHARQSLRRFAPLLDRMIGPRVYELLRSPNVVIEASKTWFAGGLTNFFYTASAIVDLLLIPFFVYYILVDFTRWRDSLEELIPPRFRNPLSRLFDEVGRILQSYVLGQLMIAMLMGCGYGIGFTLLRVPAAGGIAALAGFLNVIPYVGTVTGLVLASGFTLANSGDWWRVFGVLCVVVSVQCVEGYYLTPRILGSRLRLHPMAVFLALLVAGKLFGFLGILLAMPTTAVLQVFLKFLREIYKGSYFYHAGEVSAEVALRDPEEKVEKAAQAVLREQVSEQKGDELLAPDVHKDDPAAREHDLVEKH